MAQAGDAEGLQQVSEDLVYFWNDRLEGKLIPLAPIDPSNPVPWVHEINQLHSRHTTGLDSKYGKQARYRHFVRAVKDWTDGRWQALRSAAKKVLNGEHGGTDHAKARELIQGIDSAPNNAPRLWRKEKASEVAARLGTSPHQLFDHLKAKVGLELTQDIVSTSASASVWHGDFVWEVEPGAQAIHAYPISLHPSEREWITAGPLSGARGRPAQLLRRCPRLGQADRGLLRLSVRLLVSPLLDLRFPASCFLGITLPSLGGAELLEAATRHPGFRLLIRDSRQVSHGRQSRQCNSGLPLLQWQQLRARSCGRHPAIRSTCGGLRLEIGLDQATSEEPSSSRASSI